MAIQNQGYRKDLNLSETTSEVKALNILGGEGIANDLRILQNNLRNTSELTYFDTQADNSDSFFIFPESVESIFTNGDIVNVNEDILFRIGSNLSTIIRFSKEKDYFVVQSDGLTKFKLSETINGTPVNIPITPTTLGYRTDPNDNSTFVPNGPDHPNNVHFKFIRKNPVLKENLRNFIKPEIQDGVGEFSWVSDVNSSFDDASLNIDNARYFIDKKYQNGFDVTTDRDIKFEGVVTTGDPANFNTSSSQLTNDKSPGVFIGGTRAFSSNDQPWEEVGTSLVTESEEISVGELTFNGDIKIEGIDVNTQSSLALKEYSHKLPVVINGITYFVLLKKDP